MSSSQEPSNEVATLRHKKHVRSGGNVPPALAVPREQTRRFGVNVVVKKEEVRWKKHTANTYFSGACISHR